MERMKALDFPQALLDLFNACVHGEARKLFGPDVPTAAFAAFLEPAPPGVVEERFSPASPNSTRRRRPASQRG